jgi:magnesium chelatase family protein
MFARVTTVAFEGIEARAVDVQVQIGPGLPAFTIVGLPDKAVAESRERVRGALNAIGLALPPKRITVNLAPAHLPKEGSHYDLPIALGLMVAVGAIARDAIDGYCVLGELALDGSITAVAGALPAAIGANALGKGLICPGACGAERRGRRPTWLYSCRPTCSCSSTTSRACRRRGARSPRPIRAIRSCPT